MDPLGEKYYSWSGYNYVMDSPVRLVDPDGRESIKPIAGTVAEFKAVLDNISKRKVGRFKGKQASDYLKSLGDTHFDLKRMRPVPTQTGFFNKKKGRCIYTEKGGWIDMVHFMFYAGRAYQYKLAGKENPIGEAVQDGYMQEFTDQIFAPHSAYSYEDLPSDKYGAEFAVNYFDPESDLTFGEQIANYLNDVLCATDPENAPNYEELPEADDRSSPPSRTNKTTDPVYVKDNP